VIIWLVGIGCLAGGIVVGVVFAGRLNLSASRIEALEKQILDLKEGHTDYRNNVSDHFGMTAELVQHMTESYREVYQHLATGAQDLCSNEVARKLLPAESGSVFENNGNEEPSGLNPPKDYAAKQNPEQKGALAEDFGLDKSNTISNNDAPPSPHSSSIR
jgi:uncharacterized membrane-anchored protein YhcB (DUF1043 family)